MTTLAQSERRAVADLLSTMGPDAATLCGDWTTRDLAAHLVIRERRPDAAPGIVIEALAGHTAAVQRGYAAKPYEALVDLVRTGPGRLSLFSVPALDTLANTTEYAVHHEDIRRAQPDWEPRSLDAAAQDDLWKVVSGRAKLAFRKLDVGVELWRTDRPDAAPAVVKPGTASATLRGEPLELLLYCFGRRDQARVELSGDPVAMRAVESHPLGI